MAFRYIRRAYTSFATHVYDVPPRMLAFLIFIILSLVPLTQLNLAILQKLTYMNIIAILAVSWDLLVGRTGQISMGHAVFYGVGAYGAALLFKYFGWPAWMTIPISLLVSVGIAVAIGLPCLRVKGPYLALVTMSLPLAVTGFLFYFSGVFGADIGIPLNRMFPISIGFRGQFVVNYYLSFILMAISAVIIYRIATSRTGVVFVSLLDDELASKACGINVTKYKLMAFAISGLFGSLAGSVQAYFSSRVAPIYFDVSISLLPIIVTIVGGIGTIYGPLVGTYIYYLLNEYVFPPIVNYVAPQYSQYTGFIGSVVFMSIVIIFVIRWPRGIARAIVDKLADIQEPREIEELEKKKVKRFRQWRNALASLTRRLRKRKEKGET
jgi:branched-chain amino acid transport system permease protein